MDSLPKYLTPELQDNLFKIVQQEFPFSSDQSKVYAELPDKSYLYQGDGLKDVPFSIFHNGAFNITYSKGIIGSNTCDIDPENERLEQPHIQFFTIYALEEYLSLLKEKEISDFKIQSFLSNLKSNIISNLFYLPEKRVEDEVIFEESFVRFDTSVTLPLSVFQGDIYNIDYSPEGDRLFSFSNYGFYLFLVKLSVHYCRFREGVFRSE
jgi:hypothetical protein